MKNSEWVSARLNSLEQKVVTAGKKKRAGKNNIISVSIERELADESKRVARSLGMSHSGLIRQLLRMQIMTDDDLTIRRERKACSATAKTTEG